MHHLQDPSEVSPDYLEVVYFLTSLDNYPDLMHSRGDDFD